MNYKIKFTLFSIKSLINLLCNHKHFFGYNPAKKIIGKYKSYLKFSIIILKEKVIQIPV